MLCPQKFNAGTVDIKGNPTGQRCECERDKCAKWITDPSNLLKGECADVVAAKSMQALAGLAKAFGGGR